jgi:hypothetical protein
LNRLLPSQYYYQMDMDPIQDQSWPTIDLAVAGIGIRVYCNDPATAEQLRWRYADFPASSQPKFGSWVNLEGNLRSNALLDTGVVFRDHVLHFTARGYTGRIDVKDNRGQLNLSSKQPVEDIDYFIRVVCALLAFENRGVMFHAAGVIREGRAFLFFGHSGAGKTTVARLSAGGLILNDDLVVLLPRGGSAEPKNSWIAHATPFWNPTQVKPSSESAAVAGLFRLVQDREVFLEPMGKGQALAEFLSNIPVIPDDPQRNITLIDRSLRLLDDVPAFRLHFLPDDSFWKIILDWIG